MWFLCIWNRNIEGLYGDPKVIQCGLEILSMTTVTYFLCGIMDLFPGALRGMGRSGVPMILSIIGTVGTRIVWIFMLFPQHRSLKFLFISYPASWLFTIVMQVICFYFVRKQVHAKGRERMMREAQAKRYKIQNDREYDKLFVKHNE